MKFKHFSRLLRTRGNPDTHTHTHTCLTAFFWDNLGKPAPER